MSIAAHVPLLVTSHAMWQAAERFPWFDTARIELEVRDALVSGRLSRERGHLGLHDRPDPASLYVWTEDGRRVYALRVDRSDEQRWVVATVMRAGSARRKVC